MPPLLVFIFICLHGLVFALPSHSSKRPAEIPPPATCRRSVSPFDYSAKIRREYELPLCSVDRVDLIAGAETSPPEVTAAMKLSFLFGRATVDDYTCAPDRPCVNKACCPKETLSCNYGEEACGTSGVSPNEVCWSNCDAKSECGKDAKEAGQKCPLNVCCGKWGFCGMTEDYCDIEDHGTTGGCQSNCEQPGPKNKASGQDRVIGYYEAWRFETDCQGMGLKDIPVNSLTHLYFSFASITPGDLSITGMEGLPDWLFTDFTALKKKNPALKTIIAIGGWTFNDPEGPTQTVFSNMVSSAESRKTFIDNLMSFLREFAFDGVDFDWEYPGADDRGGVDTDGANFVQFLKELDDANKKQPVKYVVSFTVPTSYWYLRHFDLKAVDHVDFVNVMSYDLHGIWDGKNPIGSHIYGHTNLTEMKSAFDLFWRNDVPANKLNMGLGFYGRAFQLEDPACSKPGCNFKGGATKGGCSGESGILSYREIMEIVEQKKLKPVYDKTAGVKYITWNNDQWVSYDDEDTFAQKKDMAKDMGLGGFLIWAIDQDDSSLSALQAVIAPKKLGDLGAAGGKDDWQSSNKHCYITSCDGNCDAGDIKITDQPCGDDDKRSKLCCPLSGAPDPKECTWRGGESSPWCNGHCHDDEVMMEMNKWGDGDGCWDGNKAYCCKSPLAEENSCYWSGVGGSCDGDDLPLTFSGSVLTILEDVAKVILRVVGRAVPLVSLTGEALLFVLDELDLDTDKYYCCPKEDIPKWTGCDWFGEPGSCYDGHCPDMTYAQLTDSYFGGGETCGWQTSRVRTFCCEAKDDPLFLPVPLENLFPTPPSGDSVDTDFSLETDEDSDSQQGPNDAAFQFVVLASPDELQLSLDKRDGSHWDVFHCLDGRTEGEHTVQMVCTDFSETSNCHKIHLGRGVPGTILQMPTGCGPGKYAVAKSLTPTTESDTVLPRHLAHLTDRRPVVYDLTFDYDFARVPRDLGNTQMRVDYSNQDDYWDTVVAGAATKKKKTKRSLRDVGGDHVRWLEEEFRDDFHFGGLSRRQLEERWFGADVLAWLAQMVKPKIKREFNYKYDDTLTAKLIDESWSCSKGDVGYEGHLLAQALLKVGIETSFGFTLIVTDLLERPLNLKQSYLTFYNKGEITGVLTLEAVAKVFYNKADVILNIPFPGASFRIPGIATLGPQLTVEGSIDASLSLAGKIESRLEFANWEVRQVVPDSNDNSYTPKEIGDGDPDLKDNGKMDGLKEPEFYAGIQASGDVTAKISAAAEFGIRFDKQWDVEPAAVAVVAEASVMIRMASGVSTQGTCPFTWGLDVGARLFARAKAPNPFQWPGAEYKITDDYRQEVVKGGSCPDLGPIPSKRDLHTFLEPLDTEVNASSSALALHKRGLQKRAAVWGPVLSVPVGSYFCPQSTDDNENEGTPCAQIEPAFLEDYTGTIDAEDDTSSSARRDLSGEEEAWWATHDNDTDLLPRDFALEKRAKPGAICGFPISLQYPSGGEIPEAPAYGFEQPDVCQELHFGSPLAARVITTPETKYEGEHILEVQLLKQFFQHLDRTLERVPHPDPANAATMSFCDLVNEQWGIPALIIQGLANGKGINNALTPADHVAQQFPTRIFNKDEFPVLERKINSPTKNNAWGGENNDGTQKLLINTDTWLTLLPDRAGVQTILRSMRLLIGSRMYHNDFWVRDVMNRQKNRVGSVLNTLDTDVLPNNPRRTTPGYRAWAPLATRPEWGSLSLQAQWNNFAKSKFYIMQSKTMNLLNEWLPRVQQQWADDAARAAAEIDEDNDSDAVKADKTALQAIIDTIDATESVLQSLPSWLSPF